MRPQTPQQRVSPFAIPLFSVLRTEKDSLITMQQLFLSFCQAKPTGRELYQTREPRGLSPSGGKTPANFLSLKQLRALWARCGVQGYYPCLTSGAVDFDDVAALAELLEHPVDLLQTLDLYHHGDDAGLFFLVPLGRDCHNGNVHVSDAHGQLAQ